MASVLTPFLPPNWSNRLSHIPKYFVRLGNMNTPIHEWKLPNIPSGFKVYIKRDDMTGSTLSGNKVRKLEFLFADAIDKDCKNVITCGSIQSNFARSAAIAAAQLGLNCHLLLASPEVPYTMESKETKTGKLYYKDCSANLTFEGNVLLDKMSGASIYLISNMLKLNNYATDIKPRMEKLAAHIKKETGEDSYLVATGGSNVVGLYGYLTAFQEMISQGVLEDFDDIVFACGSGGTAAGLSVANYLNQSKLRIHAITVSDNKQLFIDHINDALKEVGLGDSVCADDIIDIVDGYKGRGYGLSTPEEQEFIQSVSKNTGIILDPCYTGKAANGLVQELTSNPDRFQGNRILFIHTGGIFGLFDGKMDSYLRQRKHPEPLVLWKDLDDLSI
ncbi:dcyD [Mytilus coruscus]|uniref:DcyD n=1 Tax=Mytilus coruscus TaxID=42192 RepID=A0A6J8EDJ3_MYTCO|nr:dcyD [Mytilus coruscus]